MRWSGMMMAGLLAICLYSETTATAGIFDWKLPGRQNDFRQEGTPGTWDGCRDYLKCACRRCMWKLDRPNSCYCTCPPYLMPHHGYHHTSWRQLDMPWCAPGLAGQMIAPSISEEIPGPMTPWLPPASEGVPPAPPEPPFETPPTDGTEPLKPPMPRPYDE